MNNTRNQSCILLGINDHKWCRNCFWDESKNEIILGMCFDTCPNCNGRLEYGYH